MRFKMLRIKVTPTQIFFKFRKADTDGSQTMDTFKMHSDQNSDSRRHFLELSSSHNSIKTND